jgi:hypothetical protein
MQISGDKMKKITLKECMADAVRFADGFHKRLDLCKYRKVENDGSLYCEKKHISFRWNNMCLDCKYLPKGE